MESVNFISYGILLVCIVIIFLLLRKRRKVDEELLKKDHDNRELIEQNEKIMGTIQESIKSLAINDKNQKEILQKLSKTNEGNTEILQSPFTRLSFAQMLDPRSFGNEIKNIELGKCSDQLIETYGISLSKGAQLVKSVKTLKDNSIVWELSDRGKELLKRGEINFIKHKQTGKFLPTLQKDGKFFAHIKGAKISHLAKAAKLANVAVNAAHIISGIDQMNKLKEIDRKVSFLVEGRKIDKVSKLKANYRIAKEVFEKPIGSIERAQIMNIHRDFIELRENWFSEIEYKLENIENPRNQDFFKRTFTTTKIKDKTIKKEVSDFQEEIDLISSTIYIDLGLCYGIQHTSNIEEDMISYDKIIDKMGKKIEYLSGKTEIDFNEDIERIKTMRSNIQKCSRIQPKSFNEEEKEIVDDSEEIISIEQETISIDEKE